MGSYPQGFRSNLPRSIRLPTKLIQVASFCSLVALTYNSQAETVSPKTIFTAFEKNTKQSENIQLRARQLEAQVGSLQGVYDPEIAFASGYEIDRTESLNGLSNLEDRTLQNRFRITKKFGTGMLAEFNYTLTQQRSQVNPFTQSIREAQLSENNFSLSLRQPFLYNTLGASDRLSLESAELRSDAQKMLSKEEGEELLLNGLELFWLAYKAQKSLELGLEARGIYEQLLKTTRQQKSLGQADAGDVARVEAIFEMQSQKVKRDSSQYLTQIDQLFHFLEKEPPQKDLVFDVSQELPSPPEMTSPELSQTRQWQIENDSLDAIEAEKGALKMKDLPVLDLVGEASWNGVDPKTSQSLSEAIGGQRPRYFVGIEFGFRFGNSSTRSKISNLSDQMVIQKNKLHLTKNVYKMETESLKRQILSLFQITQSAQKSVGLYRTLIAAQKRNYRQGRIQLNALIEDYNRLFDSELAAIDALSSYHIALHQWAAHTDQLIQ